MGSKKKFRWKPLNREADGVRSVRKTSVPNWLAPRFPITGGGTARPRSTATTINIVAAISEAQQSSAPYPAKAAEASAPHLRAQSRGVTVDHDSPDRISPGYRGRLLRRCHGKLRTRMRALADWDLRLFQQETHTSERATNSPCWRYHKHCSGGERLDVDSVAKVGQAFNQAVFLLVG